MSRLPFFVCVSDPSQCLIVLTLLWRLWDQPQGLPATRSFAARTRTWREVGSSYLFLTSRNTCRRQMSTRTSRSAAAEKRSHKSCPAVKQAVKHPLISCRISVFWEGENKFFKVRAVTTFSVAPALADTCVGKINGVCCTPSCLSMLAPPIGNMHVCRPPANTGGHRVAG